MIAAERMQPVEAPVLRPYPCTQWNARERRPCTAIVLDGYAPAGALIRRKCGVCNNWNLVRIDPDPDYESKER